MRSLFLFGAAGLGALAVGAAQPRVDATRHERAIDNALMFVPEGSQVKAASTGFEEVAADLFWVRAILIFGERYDTSADQYWTEWFQRMVEAVNTLDPEWRTAYFYGGTLLRVVGDVDASTRVFEAGAAALPKDPFFPFSVGMNAYLYQDDAATAATWIGRAAVLPGAPPWYTAAAAAMHQSAGARDSAIRYLQETIATTDNDAVRSDAEKQLGRLQHNQLVDAWTSTCHRFEAERGRRLASPAELGAYVGRPLPENPRGDAWVVGGDGVVRSEGAEDERLRRLRRDEMRLAGPR